MIIDISNVGKTAKKIDLTFRADEIDLDADAVVLTGLAVFTGEIQQVNERAEVRGTVTADVVLDCTRCLESIERSLNIPFRALFVEASEVGSDVDREIADEQLDESIIEDSKIDMIEVVREQIMLAMPEQVFCHEDCKGLCPKCGANLNLIECKCADDDIDPRWAALRDAVNRKS